VKPLEKALKSSRFVWTLKACPFRLMCGARMPREEVPDEALFDDKFGYTRPEISIADIAKEGIDVRGS
jgi:hypothetical protein